MFIIVESESCSNDHMQSIMNISDDVHVYSAYVYINVTYLVQYYYLPTFNYVLRKRLIITHS